MDTFRPSYFMLVPTMACQASCRYCFAKKHGEVMSMSTLKSAMDFMERIAPTKEGLQVVFHGGEPLLAGVAFYEAALPMLKERFGARLRLSIQSNLWALNEPEGDRLAELLFIYNVSVGTSLDGYREMCNEQRGEGYYENTTAAIEKLRKYGITASKICTFGKGNAEKAKRVFDEAEGGYSIHGAVPSLFDCGSGGSLAVTTEEMTQIFMDSYEAYSANPEHARVSTIDAMARGCFNGEGTLCTFKHCLGHFAAIAPDGSVYSCQRFSGCDGFSLGNVNDGLTEADILKSPAYLRLKTRQDGMASACGDCPHVEYCRGGCLYSTFAANGDKDPYCEAYKAVFDRMKRDMALEMAGELKRKLGGKPTEPAPTPLLSMADDKPHPFDQRRNLDRFRDAVERSKTRGDSLAVVKSLKRDDFTTYCMNRLSTMYLNITYRCPLRCTHCSANTGTVKINEMSAVRFVEIAREAVAAGFHSIEFSGGEIFSYPEFDAFMKGLSEIDRRGTEFVYRTSFGFSIPRERIEIVCRLFDTVIVSIDGDEEYHDRRRGKGVYQKAVQNLRTALDVEDRRCRFGLWAVMTNEERMGKEGSAVRRLASELGIGRVVFKGILPLGRGCCAEPENLRNAEARIPPNFSPRYTCGVGSSINVEPSGDVYACYAWTGGCNLLGNLGNESLAAILNRGRLFDYRLHGVDSNEKCSGCDVRYLCGGMCRSWVSNKENPDSGDYDCNKYDYYKQMTSLV